MAINVANATKIIFNRVNVTGEEIKNDLPNWIDSAIRDKIWTQVVNPSTGEPFSDVGEWLTANYPLGPGMGCSRYSIRYEELIALCETDRPSLAAFLKDNRPKLKHGGDRKSKAIKFDNVKVDASPATGNSRLYIEERLKRDFKAIWNDYLAGKYKSARQAGISAGFVVDTHDPVKRLKSNWNKATKKQRKEFLAWLKTAESQVD